MTIEAERPLTIGIDARAATEVAAGRGRLVRELLRALAARPEPHQYLCYARRPWEHPLDERFVWRTVGDRDPLWHARVGSLAGRECDVFLATNSYLTVMLTRAPTVAIVYDLLAFDPDTSPSARTAIIERLTLGGAVRRARGLNCISEATADALRARHPSAADRISVVPLGVAPVLAAPEAIEAGELPEAGFVLAVGTLEPRKNLPRLVSAYASLPVELQVAHPLVVVGALGWRTGETVDALESLGGRCRRLGYVSDGALAELYRRCAVFCYPSLGEGFGLPVLEAMAAGAPVLTSDTSSLPEVGGDAVAYADPRSVPDLGHQLTQLLVDPERRARLGASARRRAAGFTWEECAERILGSLEQAAGAGSRVAEPMPPELPLRLRAQFTVTRGLTSLLRLLGAREAVISLRHDIARARRLAFERAGSARYSRPALHGMDSKLDQIIDRDGGVFLEAGGFDGVTQSNTYYLQRFRGWRGILVEPMPELAALARRNRPGARVVQAALVAPDFPDATIAMQFGDLMTTVSRPGAEEWVSGGLVLGWRDSRTERVAARTLSSIIEEAGNPPIDLLSLDVEGHEAPALAGLDLDRHAPAWIVVEMHDLEEGRAQIGPVLGDRYVEHCELSPLDVLYRRVDPAPQLSAAVARATAP